MKIVIASAAILCLLIATSCYAQSHNAFWGAPAWNDTRIFYQHVNVSSSFLQVITRDVAFPSAGYVNNRRITAIRAFDQKTNGNGAFATIKSGGINATSTVVNFKSQRSHGINFILEIYVR
ncbi:hypothetical protein HA402_001766 [Bradysia odoriphaga]|nr:hypothetical protein HA402_001766 [Bradysia odoriphaga]